MNESDSIGCNSLEAIDKTIYFHQEINQRKSYSKKLSKYVTAFYYIDKV